MDNDASEAPPVTADSTMSRPEPETTATKPESSPHYSFVADTNTNEPPTTFTSSLSIVIDGVTPIGKTDNTDATTSISALSTSDNSGKRMPRKSKSDALAALNRSRSPSMDSPQSGGSKVDRENRPVSVLNGNPVSVASSLDMSSVKTTAPRKIPPRKTPRPFELEDCPVFYPSPEEFKDSMAYIRSVEPQAREYGIAKIVPPMGWKMPFVTDTEVSFCLLIRFCVSNKIIYCTA